MSVLSYNGIVIRKTKTNEFRSVPVMSQDNMDQVGTMYHLDVTGIVNPEETSYVFSSGASPFLPVFRSGSNPADTYNLIKTILKQPRGQLLFSYGSTVVLQSPPPSGAFASVGTDMEGGPFVRILSVIPLGEAKTFFVRIVIETTLNDCDQYAVSPDANPIASNRWTTSHTIDDRRYTRIMVRGLATFRLDSLASQGLQADAFRDLLLPAVPFGFRRENLTFTGDSAGRFLTYEFFDQQMPYSLGDPVAGLGFRTPGSLGVQGFTATAVSGTTPFTRDGPGGFAIAGPMTVSGLDVVAWGDSRSSRKNLLQFCVAMSLERLGLSSGNPKLNGGGVVRSVQVIETSHAQQVNTRIEVWRNPGNGKAQPNAVGLGLMLAQFLGVDALPNTFPSDANAMLPGGTFPQLHDGNSRGTWNGQILSQLLKQGCSPSYMSNGCVTAEGVKDVPAYACDPTFVAYTSSQLATATFGFNNPNVLRDRLSGWGTHWKLKRAVGNRLGKKAMQVSSRKKDGGAAGGTTTPPPPPAKTPFPGSGAGTTSTSTGTPAGPLPKTEIMTLTSPITHLAIEWTAESIGSKPSIPLATDPSGSLVLFEQSIEPMSVETIDGFTSIYRISGRYDYVATTAVDPDTDSIFMGIAPICDPTEIALEDSSITPDDYDPTILWSGSGSAAG